MTQNTAANATAANYKLSLQDVLNLYSTYKYFGRIPTAMVMGTLMGDTVLHNQLGTEKHYLSLSAFWGNVAYHAISKVSASNLSFPSKIALYTLSAGISGYMALKGPDMFKEKHDWAQSAKAIKLTASFFDKTGVIDGLSAQWEQGYIPAAKYVWQHKAELAYNKFGTHTLLEQTTNLLKLYLSHKMFGVIPTGLDILLAVQKNKGTLEILKLSGKQGIFQIINLLHSIIIKKLQDSIIKDINLATAELAFHEENIEVVMQLGESINKLPDHVGEAYTTSSTTVHTVISDLTHPIFMDTSNQDGSLITHTISEYPSLFLSRILVVSIMNRDNLTAIQQYFMKQIYGDPNTSLETHEIFMTPNLNGGFSVRPNTPEIYAYTNIQEIAKLGGTSFMRGRLQNFLQKPMNAQLTGERLIDTALDATRSVIDNMVFVLQLPILNITAENISTVQSNIEGLIALIGAASNAHTLQNSSCTTSSNTKEAIESAIETLQKLKSHTVIGVTREINHEMILKVTNYHLTKNASNNVLLKIEELSFTVNNPKGKAIYAISGTSGIGKTTFLTDIAKCMHEAFLSSGTIYYPSLNGKALPLIFCGTETFAPPKTSLFERITYRMPQEYISEHNDELLSRTSTLLQSITTTLNVAKEELNKRISQSSDTLSAGQKKIITLVAAILYKEYINQPVLFVIDETLANLDIDTLQKICHIIRDTFKDSIVLSVDHQWANNQEFYTDNINMQLFSPLKYTDESPAEAHTSQSTMGDTGQIMEIIDH